MSSDVLRIGGYQGAKSILTDGLAHFEKTLAEQAAAPVVERVDNVTDEGATARSLFDGIETGSFQMGYMASGYLTAKVPELGVLDIPFSVSDRHSAYKALDGDVGAMLDEAVRAQSGYRVMGFWDNGFRHLTNRHHPIMTPADCAGMIVRTLDNAIYVETMAAMGFEPLVTDVRDLKDAVVTGRVDAQENPMTNAVLFDLHLHHPHISLTGHFFGVMLFVCNADWFDKLPPSMQAAVQVAANAATAHQRQLAEDQDTQAMAVLKDAGVQIIEPDLDAFKAACSTIVERESAKLPTSLVNTYLKRETA